VETEILLKVLNKHFKDRVLNYDGPIILNVELNGDIDFKVEFVGTKQMISVGEYKDYLSFNLYIVGLNNEISKLLFGKSDKVEKSLQKMLAGEYLIFFRYSIISYISGITKFFTDMPLRIENVFVETPEKEQIKEEKMSRIGIRTVIKDIVNTIKNTNRSKQVVLPKGQEQYQFTNLPFGFNIELTLKLSKKIQDFKITSYYVDDEDVIEIGIEYNPNNITKQLYELIGELNDIVAHELEHSKQNYYGEFERDEDPQKIKDSYKYYTLPHEIPAQVAGFTRLSKLRRIPFEQVVVNWFNTHKDIHGLTQTEQEKVINKLIEFYKEKKVKFSL